MAELDGRPVDAGALRALALTNYGHFTTLRVERGRVRGLCLHLARLTRDCRLVFGVALDVTRVRELVARAVRREGPADAPVLVRVTVFDPETSLAAPEADAAPRVLVTTRPVAPAGTTAEPLRLASRRFRRELPEVKHTGLFGALHARRSARRAGYDDALFVSAGGTVLEGPTWNIAFWDGERVCWPSGDVLPGVTGELLRRALPDHRHAPLTTHELPGMAAAFVTSAGVGVRAVGSVDTTLVWDGNHPVLRTVREAYAAVPTEPLD